MLIQGDRERGCCIGSSPGQAAQELPTVSLGRREGRGGVEEDPGENLPNTESQERDPVGGARAGKQGEHQPSYHIISYKRVSVNRRYCTNCHILMRKI